MADHLSTKDWRSVLDTKEHKSVKKTGVSETLDDYASAKKKDDLGKMVSALQRIVEKAEEVKAKQDKFPKLVDFLTSTIKAAKTEQQKLAPRLSQLAEADDEDNDENTLGKALTKVRQLGPDNAWNFVLVPGKPSSGFVVKKKTPRKADIETAFEQKGKRGPFFMGRIYGEAGKFVLETEAAPVPGMAKAAKNGALLHAEMNIKVLVRGGGVELDSDSDIEPIEEGEGPSGPKPLLNEGHIAIFKDRIEKLNRVVNTFVRSPNVRVDGAADGIFGAIRVLLDQVAGDTQMTEKMKEEYRVELEALRLTLNEAVKPPVVDRARDYPDLVSWQRLADGIVRLDPEKQRQGWLTYEARLKDVKLRFDNDEALVDPARDKVGTVLLQAERLMKNATLQSQKLGQERQQDKNPELTRRMMAMERQYELIRSTPGLDPERVRKALNAFVQMRTAFSNGNLPPDHRAIPALETEFAKLADLARAKQREISERAGQQQMHDTLKGSMELVRKASVPTNLIKDPSTIREGIKTNPDVGTLVQTMSAAAKAPGMDTAKAMEDAARKVLAAFEQRRKDSTIPLNKAEGEIEELARSVLQRAQMMKMSSEYATLGDPPWTPEKADIASELQAQLYFMESAIAQGQPNYKAPDLGVGQSGASGSWWIERSETNKGDGKDVTAKKQYIFKPASKEAPVIAGLPPGSGAPREVLAKRLDETMQGAGFDIGVSPTTLASIDSSQLGNTDPRGGPLLGSMQQLAPSNGSLKPKLEKGELGDFSKTISKKNFDDVAVFDMIFANLDRHADNILVRTDPVTGTNTLVPIDHGSSLPDPELVQANSSSLVPPRNIMANPDIEQTQQVIGPETLESLMRLDPDQMVLDMKTARDDMAKRHKDTEGTISDAAIEAMAARVRFVQAAAPTVPVGLMFQMLGAGALRIAKARPEDLPALIETLRAEIEETKQGMADVGDGLDAFAATGDRASKTSLVRELTALGWAWTVTGQDFDDWMAANAKLVGRILKTRIVNPELQKEIERLTPLALVNDPRIETTIRTYDPGGKYNLLFEAANKPLLKGPPLDTPLDTIRQEFEQLGGLATLKKAALTFPGTVAPTLPEPDGKDEDEIKDRWIARVVQLRLWAALEEKGGVAELLRLSPSIPREMSISGAIRTIDEKTLSSGAMSEVMDMDEEEVEQKTASNYAALQNEVHALLEQLREPNERQRTAKYRDTATTQWTEGKPTGALALLGYAKRNCEKQLATEVVFGEGVEARKKAMIETLEKADENVRKAVEPHLVALFKVLDESVETCSHQMKSQAEREFSVRVETAEKGEESEYRKAEVALPLVEGRVNAHARLLWHDELVKKLNKLRGMLDTFDLGNLPGQIRYFGVMLDALDLMKEALGPVDPQQLPEAVKVILQDWRGRIENNDRTQEGPQSAQKVRELLMEQAK